ncbi:hypothetical protein EXS71_03375 [Candidatus Uhrbacteria bacterium]|nr:hypothetical protein [Candidatus Uhrbacteria bacterium]
MRVLIPFLSLFMLALVGCGEPPPNIHVSTWKVGSDNYWLWRVTDAHSSELMQGTRFTTIPTVIGFPTSIFPKTGQIFITIENDPSRKESELDLKTLLRVALELPEGFTARGIFLDTYTQQGTVIPDQPGWILFGDSPGRWLRSISVEKNRGL